MPTLLTRYRVFPTGADLIPPSMATLLDHSSLTLSAPSISLPDPNDPNHFFDYAFRFWNLRGSPELEGTTTDALDTVPDVGTAPLQASAWYVPVGGGGGGKGVSTVAFSDDADDVLGQTPIASVTPAAAWAGGNATFVDTSPAAVTIVAKNAIDVSERFEHWLVFGDGSPAGANLSEPRGGSALAIATYKTPAPQKIVVGRGGQLASILIGGVAVDGGGLVIPVGGGTPHPVGPWGPDVFARMAPAERSIAIGLIVNGLASTIAEPELRTALQRESLNLASHGIAQLQEGTKE